MTNGEKILSTFPNAITLPIILIAFIYEIIRKYMIALIEFIVAINKNKKE